VGPAALASFADRLAAYVRFEERELFKVAQRVLDDAALEAIANASPSKHP
jgi:hypothetical protein